MSQGHGAALAAWQRRGDLAARDELWRLACWEAAAREFRAGGLEARAQSCEARAREIAAERIEWKPAAA